MDIKGALTNKIGPLPVWGWALIGGGTLAAVARVVQARAAGGNDGVTIPVVPADSSYLGNPYQGIGSGGAIPLPGSIDQGNGGEIIVPGPRTNNEWRVAAERYLIGIGYDPVAVTDAVNRFLIGGDVALSARDVQIVGEALRKVGSIPEAPYNQNIPNPTPVPTVPDTQGTSNNPITKAFLERRGNGIAPGGLGIAARGTPGNGQTVRQFAATQLKRFAPEIANDNRHIDEFAQQLGRFYGKSTNAKVGRLNDVPVYIRRF